MTVTANPAERARRHHDAPDSAADFEHLDGLPAGPEREVLTEVLTEAWLPMAHRLARRFRTRGESLEDLEQVAALGLFKAVNRYNAAHGPFEPYAIPTIVGEIKRHFRDHAWDIHVPRRVQEARNKVRVSIRELTSAADGDRSPTVAQIAEHAGISAEEVLAGMEAMESFRTLSLDAQLNSADDNYSLADTLGAAEGRYDTVVARESVKPGLAELPEREQRILDLRFFHDMTQSRIGEELGISQMHVSRLLTHACQQVRDRVESDELPAEQEPTPAAQPVPAAA